MRLKNILLFFVIYSIWINSHKINFVDTLQQRDSAFSHSCNQEMVERKNEIQKYLCKDHIILPYHSAYCKEDEFIFTKQSKWEKYLEMVLLYLPNTIHCQSLNFAHFLSQLDLMMILLQDRWQYSRYWSYPIKTV